MKILTTPRMERCIGCHACSLACARLVHKRLSWDTAGIRILSSGGLSTGFEAKALSRLRSCTLRCGVSHGGLFPAQGRRRGGEKKPVHSMRRLRCGLSG